MSEKTKGQTLKDELFYKKKNVTAEEGKYRQKSINSGTDTIQNDAP